MARRLHTTRIGAGLLAGAGLLTVASLAVARTDSDRADTSASPVRVSIVPSTIGTRPPATARTASDPPTTTSTPRPAPAATTPTPSATTTPVTLPASSASLPEPVSVLPPAPIATIPPVGLHVPDLGLDVPVRSIGVQPDGQLEIPDETEVGWYRLGAAPTTAGATVIAGHVSWNDTVGPFAQLATLEPGGRLSLDLADGTQRTYVVVERAQYPKLMLPRERIWTRTGPETLVLVTCGGDFNRDIRRFVDNIVVYAVPVA